MKSVLPNLCAIAAILGLGACDRQSNVSSQAAPTPGVETTAEAGWRLTERPEAAAGVAQLKATAAEGDAVVLHGRIGGNRSPLVSGSPVFTIVDMSLPSCADNPDDKCATPWDYCCEPRDVLSANSATVRLVDQAGNPLTVDAAGSLKPLDEVIVVGTVAPRPNSEVLVIQVTGVYRVDG